MWYVVQTKSDNEQLVMDMFRATADPSCFQNLFIPMFEDVRKKDGKATIHLRRLFPGYFFVETDTPKEVFNSLKKVPEFKKILGAVEKDGTTCDSKGRYFWKREKTEIRPMDRERSAD